MPIVITLIAFLAAFIAAVGGWVSNLMTTIELMGQPIAGEFVLRTVGIFVVPLGAILGWI